MTETTTTTKMDLYHTKEWVKHRFFEGPLFDDYILTDEREITQSRVDFEKYKREKIISSTERKLSTNEYEFKGRPFTHENFRDVMDSLKNGIQKALSGVRSKDQPGTKRVIMAIDVSIVPLNDEESGATLEFRWNITVKFKVSEPIPTDASSRIANGH